MKYALPAFFALAALIASCGPSAPEQTAQEYTAYGEAFDTTGAIPMTSLIAEMKGREDMDAVVKCTIMQTCTKAGCWMDVENPEGGDPITIFMKDHEFGVPLSACSGLSAIVNARAYYDTLSVEYQQHLAEDAGKSPDEISLITEPRFVLALEASGVMIKGYKGTEGGEIEKADCGHDHDHDHGTEGEEHAH
jgi:hypothetical protein